MRFGIPLTNIYGQKVCGVLLIAITLGAGNAQTQNASQGQVPLRFSLRPFKQTSGVASTITATVSNFPTAASDPRNAELSAWLASRLAAAKSTNGSVLAATGTSVLSQTAGTNAGTADPEEVDVRKRNNGTAAQVIRRPSRKPTSPVTAQAARDSETTAKGFLKAHRRLFSISDPDTELTFKAVETDDLGLKHLRATQVYQGLRVWPCEVTVHFDRDDEVQSVESTVTPTPTGAALTPVISSAEAHEMARKKVYGGANAETKDSELIIYSPLDRPARLAWSFSMSSTMTDAKRCVVDAETGEILWSVSLVHDGAVIGSGSDGLGINRTLNLWQTGALYHMADTSKPMYVASSSPPSPATTRGQILIYDCRNTPTTSNPNTLGSPVYSASANANSGWTPDAVSAAYGLSETYDYYSLKHGWKSFDGKGSSIIAYVRLGINFQNAFWNDQLKLMAFGEGFSRSLDVCAHEMTHAVINSIGDGGVLDYYGQPGALNESFADIFGEMIESRTKGTNDWLVGSELLGGALRSMSNPALFGQPGRMSDYVSTSSDDGGVHINSGIINRAYFLLAGGLNGALGNVDAERIFYRALTLHLQKQSQFVDARHACISAAEALFGIGSRQALKTSEAFDTVEIFDAPPPTPPSRIPAVQAPDSTLFLRLDGMGRYSLYRRETARGDGSNGSFLYTEYYLAAKRVAVSGDGSLALFVDATGDLGSVETDGNSAPDFLNQPGTYHTVAISADSRYAALGVLDTWGNTTSEIHILDLQANTSRAFPLYANDSEGRQLDIVEYADVMAFTADRRHLIYDALCTTTVQGYTFQGWAIFALDVLTGEIQTLSDPNLEFDVGNPALGRTRANLLTVDVTDRTSGASAWSSIYAADLFTGKVAKIGDVGGASGLITWGVPSYTGDDSAIVYSRYDSSVTSKFTLMRQPVASDGITKVGSPSALISDADFGVVYRRGAFVGSNAAPTISITSPANGQSFSFPANLTIQAAVTDADGTISKVEFYRGSSKLGERTAPPYVLSWSPASVGSYRIAARAIDNLGATRDSAPVNVFVTTNLSIVNPGFENPVLADGQENGPTGYDVPGWTEYGELHPWAWDVYNPDVGTIPEQSHGGSNVLYSLAYQPTTQYVEQQLAYVLQPNTKYTLSAWVADPDSKTPLNSIQLMLFAGSTLLASKEIQPAAADIWTNGGLVFQTADNHAQLGEFLKIRIMWSTNASYQVFVDDILLTTSPADPTWPLVVQTTGKGTVTPNYQGQLLTIGKVYSLTAVPAAGFAFSNWTDTASNVITNRAMLSFVMQPYLAFRANFVDIQKPTITITSPTLNQRWSNAVFTVAGKAADNTQVAQVFYQFNNGDWTSPSTANNWSNWMASVTLSPGQNAVRAYAVDAAGNRSTTNTATMTYVLSGALVVGINGRGTINPNYNGKLLEIGKVHSMTATPGAGYAFSNWTDAVGTLITNKTMLSFIMRSNLVFAANFADIQKPTVTITSPILNQRWSNAIFTAAGKATDNGALAGVQVQLNGSPFQPAIGTSNWWATVDLSPGTNTFRVKSVDTNANESLLATRSLFYVVPSQLTLLTNGNGRVTGATNGQWLEVGRGYRLTAIPALRHLFAEWSGDLWSTNLVLNFLMQSNLTLQANFVTNPFVGLKGTYYGLFAETNAVRNHDRSGSFTLTIAEGGTYSASFQLGAKRLAAAGRFDWLGRSLLNLKPSLTNTVAVRLQLDVTNLSARVEGGVGNESWMSPLFGYRPPVYSDTNASPQMGKYTVAIPGSDDAAASPGGDGYGAVSVSRAGLLTLAGKLADGTYVSQSVPISADQFWALYISLYSAKGSALSWMTFTNEASNDVQGWLSWIKPALATSKYYPLGFTNEHEVLGSRYVTPGITNRLLNLTNGIVAFDGGNLPLPITNSVLLTTNNKVTNLSSNKLSITPTLTTGLFTGSVTDTNTGKVILFYGVALPKLNAGYGYFLGTNQSGQVYFGPE